MYKNKKINKNIKRILIVFSTLTILLISFGLLFNKSNNKNNNVGLSSQTQNISNNDIKGIEQVSLGASHTAILTKTGQVYTWGCNEYFQLGNASTKNENTPQNITSYFPKDHTKITQISIGGNHSFALTKTGQVYAWGQNNYGQLGDTSWGTKGTPWEITSFFPNKIGEIIQISSGPRHSAALSSSGQVYTWGSNSHGQLGTGKSIGIIQMENTPQDITNKFLGLEKNSKVIQISLGKYHTIALTSSGQIYSQGDNDYGQLGDTSWGIKGTPWEITSFLPKNHTKIIQIQAGFYHSSALSFTGQVYIWGDNQYSQLGNNRSDDGANKSAPTEITSYFPKDHTKITQISLGQGHSVALTETGQIYTWGRNDRGQLGDTSFGMKGTPWKIKLNFEGLTGKIIQVSLGVYHSSALSSTGQIFTWGYNKHGQLGNGKNDGVNKSIPQLIIDPPIPFIPLSPSISPSSINIGAIVGGVIGGLAALGLIGGLTFFFIKKKNDPNFKMPSFKKK